MGEYAHACGVVDVFGHFACGVVGEYNMLVGLWKCVCFACGVVGEYICLWGCGCNPVCLWGCGCKSIACGVVCVFACGVLTMCLVG